MHAGGHRFDPVSLHQLLRWIMTQYAILYWSLVLFVGAMAGNFMTVAEYRIPLKKTILSGRSFCPECKTDLKLFEILPIISWLCLLGKCRHCGVKVPVKYLLIELCLAAMAALSFIFIKTTLLASLVFTLLALIILQSMFIRKHGRLIFDKQVLLFGFFAFAITFILLSAAEPLRYA